ncbi:unnamed protein product, partial [Prorocentrum cordatum]
PDGCTVPLCILARPIRLDPDSVPVQFDPTHSPIRSGSPLRCCWDQPAIRCPGVGAARTPADDGDSWTCSCGFVNSAKNVQCGGKGVLGCKKARAEQVVADLKQYREQMNQRSVSTQARS